MKEEVTKIHFGCGSNKLSGWQNLDLPHVDVRNRLNFASDSVDFIFHEHLLEHLDEVDGFSFLKECYRILKLGGKMRISCPSIDGIVWVYQNWDQIPKSEWTKKHSDDKNKFINNAIHLQTAGYRGKKFDVDGSVKVVNNSNLWHKFLDDKGSIEGKLTKIGFRSIEFTEKRKSNIKTFQNLERRSGGKFKNFPKQLDLTVETTK